MPELFGPVYEDDGSVSDIGTGNWFDGNATSWNNVPAFSTKRWGLTAAVTFDQLHIFWHYGGAYIQNGSAGPVSGAAGPFAIDVGASPSGPWSQILEDLNPVGAIVYPDDFDRVYTLDAPVTGQYFRWRSTGGNNNDVYAIEAELIGDPVPPPDPPPVTVVLNGVTIERATAKTVRVELNNVGAGSVAINRGDSQATEANLTRGNVLEFLFPQIHPTTLVECLLEEGDWDLLKSGEEGEEELRFGGRGILGVLGRAVMDYQNYTGSDIVDEAKGYWQWNAPTEGDLLLRIINECQAVTRPSDPIPMVVPSFDSVNDSQGAPWSTTPIEGGWRIPIGSNILDEILRLANTVRIGLHMRPGFDFYVTRGFGFTRTSTTFAANKVRFVKGVNIVTELTRGMAGRSWATDAIVKRADGVYTRAAMSGTFDYDQETYVESSSDNTNTAVRQAESAMQLRQDAQESLIFEVLVPYDGQAQDELTGLYLPGPDWSDNGKYWVGDIVTLHTGTGDLEYDNVPMRIYALTLYEDNVGQLRCIVELNAPYLNPGTGESIDASPSAITSTSGGSAGGGTGSIGPHFHSAYATDVEFAGHVNDTADAHDASAISFTPAGTIAATNVQDAIEEVAAEAGGGGALPWFDVTDVAYGAVHDGSTNDRSAINDAIAALNTAGAGVLYFPAVASGDYYYVSDALTAITVPCLILGDGGGPTAASPIATDHPTANLFTLSAASSRVSGLKLINFHGTETAGAAIAVTTGDGSHNRYDNLWIEGFYDGLSLLYGGEWSMSDCEITNPVRYGVRIANIDIPDGGDWSMSNVWFGTRSRNATAAIRQESAGGGKIANVKINQNSAADQVTYSGVKRYTTGWDVVIAGSTNSTSVMTCVGTSIENVSGDAIQIATTTTGVFGLIAITGFQVGLYGNNAGRAINISAAATGGIGVAGGIGGIVIDGCVLRTDGTARAAISLTNTDSVTLGDIQLVGFNDRYTGSGDTNTTDGTATLDFGESGDIQAVGTTSAAGATGEVADAGHVHTLGEAAAQTVGHYELLMTGTSPPEPLEDGTGTDWLYVWVI